MKNIPRWLNQGREINATTIDEAIIQGGIDWTVSKRPILTLHDIPPQGENIRHLLNSNGTSKNTALRIAVEHLLSNNNEGNKRAVENLLKETERTFLPISEHAAVVRDDTQMPFTTVGRVYTCLNNKSCLEVIQPLIDQYHLKIERIGMFNHGANIWVILSLPEPIKVGAKVFDQYIKIAWSHDATARLTARTILVDEKNLIYSPELGKGVEVEIAIKHTTNAPEKLLEARLVMEKHGKYVSHFKTVVEKMIKVECKDVSEYLKLIFPNSEKSRISKGGEELFSRDHKTAKTIEQSFTQHKKASARGSLWDFYETVSEYADTSLTVKVRSEGRGDKDAQRTESRLKSNMSGGVSMKLKQKAWNILTKGLDE